jgi:predicted AAA+ superfamily ATPase
VSTFVRPHAARLRARLLEPRARLQVVSGPRQVGKSTLVRQVLGALGLPHHYASADAPAPPDARFIDLHWDLAARLPQPAVLVLDEVQKITSWAEAVKARWDADSADRSELRVVLLGSSPLLVQRGLVESLAGRFELVRLSQWSWPEMRDGFGWDLERFVRFGGYPGAAPLAPGPGEGSGEKLGRWAAYVRDALVETTVARDVLLMTRVDKPALLRQLFELAAAYSARELSYTKMLGQLQEAGNTTTLAHYLELLSGAGLVSGLSKHAGEVVRARGSSPKLQVHDTALVSSRWGALTQGSPANPGLDPRAEPEAWGRLVESAVGAHLVRTAPGDGVEVRYWREGHHEVDFVLAGGGRVAGLEVKTARSAPPKGLARFRQRFPQAKAWVVGPGAISLEEALTQPAAAWL